MIIITGSGGLIGSEAVRHFCAKKHDVIRIDNDMRAYFFGKAASTAWNQEKLIQEFPLNFRAVSADIRSAEAVEAVFKKHASHIDAVIHTAAQPSHDWAAREPQTDFAVNANGTLNLLEATRTYAPQAVFIYTSTNKVYGDLPNLLPLVEQDERWEVDKRHRYAEHGIDETMSIDQSKHSLFGVSKLAADVLVQEYGRYFGMKTVVFRGGCLTGPSHSGTELHGFLSYVVKCAISQTPYTIYGYKGKQVRDNIHSKDLINAFSFFIKNPRPGEIYNMGGSRHSNISMMEAIRKVQEMSGKKLQYTLIDKPRSGDHIWYISDVRKFQMHYPEWKYEYTIDRILDEMITACKRSA
jgi:Nucleoside-diphosphate-sugar epimerases